ncbi:MAG: hypothetical protein JWN76_1090, partial [Chitinophagaceae bacterium]|nr:hypothetical protein [Chitinophagaceae bacterium]
YGDNFHPDSLLRIAVLFSVAVVMGIILSFPAFCSYCIFASFLQHKTLLPEFIKIFILAIASTIIIYLTFLFLDKPSFNYFINSEELFYYYLIVNIACFICMK